MSDPRDVLRYCLAVCNGRGAEATELLAQHPELAGNVHVAAVRADVATLAALLDRDPELVDAPLAGPGLTPLALLCHARPAEQSESSEQSESTEHVRAAELLLARGADPNAVAIGTPNDRDTWHSPLGGAAGEIGSVELCRALLAAGAEANDGIALFRATETERWACLDELLAGGGDLNHVANRRGTTPLHHVLDTHYTLDRVEELLARGADPSVRDGESVEFGAIVGLGETALHVAVRRRRIEPLELLLSNGAELEARTRGGMTAWRHALRRGFDDVAAWLAKRGADTTLAAGDELAALLLFDDVDGAYAALRANPALARDLSPDEARLLPDLAARNLSEAVELLLERGWDPVARGLDGGTALHQAAWFGAPETAELLIERGAPLDVVCRVHDGTPLAWVAHGSSFSGGAEANPAYARVAELLCAAGAILAWSGDPERDPGGRRLLAVAAPEVAEVLRRHGAGGS